MMNEQLTAEIITDKAVVIDYIDEYLYDRLKSDNTKGVGDFVDGAAHIAIKKKDRIVGVISFGLKKDHAVIHPKIRREHMIYAKRACMLALEYLDSIGEKVVAAIIPDCFEANKRMALSCGMVLHDIYKKDKMIGGKPINSGVYIKVLR